MSYLQQLIDMRNQQREQAAAPWAALGAFAGDIGKVGTHFQDKQRELNAQQRERELAAMKWDLEQGKRAAEAGQNELAHHYYNQVAEKAKPLFGDSIPRLVGGTKQQGWEDSGTPSADGRSYARTPHMVPDFNNPQTVGAMSAMFGVDPPKISEISDNAEAGYFDRVTHKWVTLRPATPKAPTYHAPQAIHANGRVYLRLADGTMQDMGTANYAPQALQPMPGPGGAPVYGRPTPGAPAFPPRQEPAPVVMPGPGGKPVYGHPKVGDPAFPPSAVNTNDRDLARVSSVAAQVAAAGRKWVGTPQYVPGTHDILVGAAPNERALRQIQEDGVGLYTVQVEPGGTRLIPLPGADLQSLRPPSGFVWAQAGDGVRTLVPKTAGVQQFPDAAAAAAKAQAADKRAAAKAQAADKRAAASRQARWAAGREKILAEARAAVDREIITNFQHVTQAEREARVAERARKPLEVFAENFSQAPPGEKPAGGGALDALVQEMRAERAARRKKK